MTRQNRSPDEKWAIKLLLSSLMGKSDDWQEEPGSPTDRPDLTLTGPNGIRVACEITQVGLSKWFQWQNDKRFQAQVDVLAEYNVPREVDIWLEKAIDKKLHNLSNYKNESNANEVWLLVHGGINPIFDFFVLDQSYDIPLLVKAAKNENSKFDRIYVASSRSDKIICIYPYEGASQLAPDISKWDNLKMLTIRSRQIETKRGVNTVRIGEQFKTSDVKSLPPLDPRRMQKTD